MGVRLQGTYYDQKDLEYLIEIIDKEGGDDNEITFFEVPGAEWQYSGKGNDILTRILECNAIIKIMVTDPAVHESFRDDLLTSDEGRFILRITAIGNTSVTEFVGVILVDQIVFEDQYYPYSFQINAVSSITRLKEVPYIPPVGDILVSLKTFKDHLFNCIKLMDIEDLYGSSDPAVLVAVNWYESEMPNTTDDPLTMSGIPYSVFAVQEDANAYKYFTAYEAIEMMCTLFNARFFFSQGLYYFEQINIRQDAIYDAFWYTINGTFLAKLPVSGDVTINQSTFAKESGGTFGALPPVRSIVLQYDYNIGDNYLHDAVNAYTYLGFNERNLGNIDLDPDIDFRFLFSGIIAWELALDDPFDPDEIPEWKLRFRIQLKVGDKWLKRDIAQPNFYSPQFEAVEWSDTEAYYFFDTDPYFIDFNIFNGSQAFELLTPIVEEAGDILFNFQFWKIYKFDPNTGQEVEVIPMTFSVRWWLQQPSLTTVGDGEERVSLTRQVLVYSNSNNNSDRRELYLRTGDGPNSTNQNRVRIYDQPNWIESGREWSVAATGGAYPIQRLLLLEVARLFIKPVLLMYSNIIFSQFAPAAQRRILYAGDAYLFVNGNISSFTSDVAGTWFKLQLSTPDAGKISSTETFRNNINSPNTRLGEPSTTEILVSRPQYELISNFSGLTINVDNQKVNLAQLSNAGTLQRRQRLHVYKNGQKLIYDVAFTIDTDDNEIILEPDYEGFEDFFEIFFYL